MVRKFSSQGMQKVSDAVASAQMWARSLVQRESRGPGDLKNAMRRVSQRYGIDYSILYSLRYRPPNDILVGTYERLRNAYESECERQERLLRHEREITKAKTIIGAALARAADSMGGEDSEVVK